MNSQPKIEDVKTDCFVIMPISDTDGYPAGHFGHVYQNIIAPACVQAGYNPTRADQVKATNLIHLDILKKLIDAPIAICDLSSRNPNVLFELGIRQAFDRPVVLIQEIGTPRIFDITPLRYTEYSKEMRYHDVLSTQIELRDAILATVEADGKDGNINSIVRLLALDSSAKIPEIKSGKNDLAYSVLQAEMREIRKSVDNIANSQKFLKDLPESRIQTSVSKSFIADEMITNEAFSVILTKYDWVKSSQKMSKEEKVEAVKLLMGDVSRMKDLVDTVSGKERLENLFRNMLAFNYELTKKS